MIGGAGLNAQAHESLLSRALRLARFWRARLLPVAGIGLAGVFLYWTYRYRSQIGDTFANLGGLPLLVIVALMMCSIGVTVLSFTALVRGKGYAFRAADAYHALNLSQLASMIPGGIWGYAGLAGALWSKGIKKSDSVIVIFLYTLISLSACAIVGFSGLAAVLGWGYAVVCVLPFALIAAARDWLDGVRATRFPESSALPSRWTLIKVLLLSILVWVLSSAAFASLLYTSTGFGAAPLWVVTGAYSAAYLGGYVSLLAPSGLGVSEGLVSLLLHSYIGTDKILSIAISFRIIQTLITWLNILVTVVLTSRQAPAAAKGSDS